MQYGCVHNFIRCIVMIYYTIHGVIYRKTNGRFIFSLFPKAYERWLVYGPHGRMPSWSLPTFPKHTDTRFCIILALYHLFPNDFPQYLWKSRIAMLETWRHFPTRIEALAFFSTGINLVVGANYLVISLMGINIQVLFALQVILYKLITLNILTALFKRLLEPSWTMFRLYMWPYQ